MEGQRFISERDDEPQPGGVHPLVRGAEQFQIRIEQQGIGSVEAGVAVLGPIEQERRVELL
jgi:hypothetical protein